MLWVLIRNTYLKPKVALQFLSLNISIPVSQLVSKTSKQNSGKMIYASYSNIELSVLSLETNNLHFLTNSLVD